MRKFLLSLSMVSLLSINAQTCLWAKQSTASGGGGNDGFAIATDATGNVFVSGIFSGNFLCFGTNTITNASTYQDVFLAKYDNAGNAQWAQRIGGLYDDGATFNSNNIATDASGNVFITGYFGSASVVIGTYSLTKSGNYDMFLAKYDPNGNVLWALKEGGVSGSQVYGNSVSTDLSGNVYICGKFLSSSISFGTYTLTNGGSYDFFLVKYDPNGNLLWAKGWSGNGDDIPNAVCTNTLGHVFVTGYFTSSSMASGTFSLVNSGPTQNETFIIKYDSNGNILWAVKGSGVNNDMGHSITSDNFDNVYIGGEYDYTVSFGSYTFTNVNTSFNPYTEGFLVKFDANGNTAWAKDISGTVIEAALSVTVRNNDLFVAGCSNSQTLSLGGYNISPVTGSEPMFVAQYDLNGTLLNAFTLTNGGEGGFMPDGLGVATDSFCNLYIAGDFITSPFIIGTNTLSLTSAEDVFVAKMSYNCLLNNVKESEPDSGILLFPNPSDGSFRIITHEFNRGNLILINMLGVKVHEQIVTKEQNEINPAGIPPGLYSYVINGTNQKNYYGKVLIR